MTISGLHSAKRLKFKLRFISQIDRKFESEFIEINGTANEKEFFIKAYDGNEYLLSAGKNDSSHLKELLLLANMGHQINLFVVEEEYEEENHRFIVVQSYFFASMINYKTEIIIQVPERILDRDPNKFETLRKQFVCNDIKYPAIFALRYRDKKKTDIRLVSDSKFLNIQNTPRGLIASDMHSKRDRINLPIDVFLAPDIKFVKEEGSTAIDGTLAKDLDKIQDAATYFARWEAYNELAKKEISTRVEEFGKIPYTRYEKFAVEGGTKFTFYIEEEIDKTYIDSSIAVFNAKENKKGELFDVWVGEIASINESKVETILKRNDEIINIPVTGKLVLSVSGDIVIIRRRQKARDRMMGLRSPIKAIVPLIEEGSSEYASESNWANNKAITAELKKNFKEVKTFNEQQKSALELAINTPDIALIQGPPGTGKTTVIKAICERYREIYEYENKGDRPKILISSFQHDAVDNAIAKTLSGELPAFRIGKKREDQFNASVADWVSNVKSELGKNIGNYEQSEFGKIRKRLSDAYFSYKNTGEKPEDAVKIIKEYLSVPEIIFPAPLKAKADEIIATLMAQKRQKENHEDRFAEHLRNQRLTREAFNDDGERNAYKLLAYIKLHPELNINDSYVNTVKMISENGIGNEVLFIEYKKAINAIIEEFFPDTKKFEPLVSNNINACLQELAVAFDRGKINSTNDLEAQKAMIVGEFLERFEDEAESLVRKYSLTTAATCQQSMMLSGSEDEYYDLVIVDEAARATPLDLFIPMSMGRKIILVGDHKQLPHMLEPDVLKLILDDPKYKDIPDLDISLFERLFEMFQKGNKPKSILLKKQYRMHPVICTFVSEAFYDNNLESGITGLEREIPIELFNGKPLVFINVSKNHGIEKGKTSKSRLAEARFIAKDARKILEICPNKKIGIITFYSAQKDLIENEIRKVLDDKQINHVEWGSVDAFQGKEFDFVLLSCVRSNNLTEEKQSIGFLAKPNRICVALSRAKYQLVVYGDAETIKKVECFNLLYRKCNENMEGYYCEY
jgi:tRNA A37 threonylcarbamoyladenosine biosynthesis protein TsaE